MNKNSNDTIKFKKKNSKKIRFYLLVETVIDAAIKANKVINYDALI